MTENNPEGVTLRTGIYGVFDEFLKKTIIGRKSYFSDDSSSDVFIPTALNELVERYVKKIIGKNGVINNGNGAGNESSSEEKLKEKLKKNSLDFKDKVNEQLFNQDKNIFNYEKAVFDEARIVFANLMWLQYLPAIKPGDNSQYGVDKCNRIKDITKSKVSYYSCDGRAKYGMAARRLDEDLTDLILLFNELVGKQWDGNENKELGSIKDYIIRWCLDLKEDDKSEKGIRKTAYQLKTQGRNCPTDLLPIHNMLLHLCKPQHYDDISVSGHKKKIVDTFGALIPKGKDGNYNLKKARDILDDANAYNKKYYIILNELNKLENQQANSKYEYKNLWNENGGSDGAIGDNVKIYDYKWMWNIGADKDYSVINALKFKKAIILYGPPGTSKTYSAKNLAKNLIFQKDYLGKDESKKSGIKDFLENKDVEKQIHRLQLHPNYTYEDFIWGYQIKNEKYMNKNEEVVCVGNQTEPRKGYFLRLIDEISKENEKSKRTHVLILDEINRVDLSRLFGELFSAIENRDEAVDLPVVIDGLKEKIVLGQKVSQIRIPENLYIIGTMNEIDFSLERVDFALRRRFAWFPYGYSEDTLNDILSDKNKKKDSYEKIISKFDDDTQSEYLKSCTALNSMIEKDPDLGEQYQIGHTFFAELVDIWKDMPDKEIKFVKTILWNISIDPMIKAYLGNCDDTKMDSFRVAFGIDPLKQRNKKDGAK